MGNVCFTPLQGGEIIETVIGNPGGGNNWTYTIPANYEYEVRLLYCLLSTEGAAHNVWPIFEIVDTAATLVWRVGFSVATTVIEYASYSLYVGCERSNFSLIGLLGVHFYNDALPFMRLTPGYIIRSAFTGLGALDGFGEIRLVSHRWRT